jgi:lipopolysaccharide biosynthesis glycosyltransferase
VSTLSHTSTTDKRAQGKSARRKIRVACAADDNYAMPLAVTLTSAALSLDDESQLEVHLLNGNINPDNQARLRETAAEFGIQLEWVEADFSVLDALHISHHISHVAYYRLLLSRYLDASFEQILYLDSDLLIRRSISQLWDQPFDGCSLLAVPDVACPLIDARRVTSSRLARPYLATLRPVGNYRQLGIRAEAPYFNSGVLLIDLESWRQQQMCERLVECLQKNGRHIWCWDQYALNVCLADQWRPISPQWNQGAHIFEFPSERYSPFEEQVFVATRDDPHIVHFTTEWKPWHFENTHPFRDQFFEVLDKTAWQGWRPEKTTFTLKRWWQKQAIQLQKRATIAYRKMENSWT